MCVYVRIIVYVVYNNVTSLYITLYNGWAVKRSYIINQLIIYTLCIIYLKIMLCIILFFIIRKVHIY